MLTKDYTWHSPTEQGDPGFWKGVDAVEVSGCQDDGRYTIALRSPGHPGEPYDGPDPDFWSVYAHRPGEGAEVVADFNTKQAAIDYAYNVAAERKLRVQDYT